MNWAILRSKIETLESTLLLMGRILLSMKDANIWVSRNLERKGKCWAGWSDKNVALSNTCRLSMFFNHSPSSWKSDDIHEIIVNINYNYYSLNYIQHFSRKLMTLKSNLKLKYYYTEIYLENNTYLTGLHDKLFVTGEQLHEPIHKNFSYRIIK